MWITKWFVNLERLVYYLNENNQLEQVTIIPGNLDGEGPGFSLVVKR